LSYNPSLSFQLFCISDDIRENEKRNPIHIVQIKLKKKKSQKSREIPFTGKSDEMKCRPIVVMVASLRNNDDNNNRERHLQLTQK